MICTPLDLNRTFSPVARNATDDVTRRMRRFWPRDKERSWPDLLRLPCAVILGEAGTGKTTELRAAAAKLEAEGRRAFFLPLEAVAQKGIAKSLDIDHVRVLREWLSSPTDEAWIFLDSVDESKLKGHTLSGALATVGQELEAALPRTHLILSSRVSDWRVDDERAVLALRKHLWRGTEGGELAIVQLAPLTGEQIGTLARDHGLTDVPGFLEAVRSANAWDFLERPLDVRWLVDYWMKRGKLGSFADLVDFNISERLAESPGRPSVLSVEEARGGARRLALAAILSQVWAFRLPGEPVDPHTGASIDPGVILPDWANERTRVLLDRGLFDEATYGRVRIHHRTVQEFLAAEQLRYMVSSGFPRDELEWLLFRETAGRTVVPAHLTSVVAWYAGRDRALAKLALKAAPQHLIDEGDPAQLLPQDRSEALRAYIDQFGGHTQIFHHFDSFGLKRFACRELVETIRELLTATESPAHLKRLLLNIVESGPLHELADFALAIALADGVPPEVRIAAIEATDKTGTLAQRRRLAELVGQPCGGDKGVVAALIGRLFPEAMTPEDLLRLLFDVEPTGPHEVSSLSLFVASSISSRCDPAQRCALLRMLSSELIRSRSEATDPGLEPRDERIWLSPVLADLLTYAVGDGLASAEVIERSLDALETCLEHVDYLSGERTIELLDDAMGLRRAFFWRSVRRFREREGRFPRRHWDLRFPHRLGFGPRDSQWLRADCIGRVDVRERMIAFISLMTVTQRSPDIPNYWSWMNAVATESDSTHATDALRKHLQRARAWDEAPVRVPGLLQSRAIAKRRARQHEERLAVLHEIIEQVRSGQRLDVLFHFHTIASERGVATYSAVSLEKIAEIYDADVAAAARDGFRNAWRKAELPLSETWTKPNEVPGDVIAGLVGVALEVSEGLDVSGLPEPLLRKAIALAPWEANAFPSWLAQCAQRHPSVVRDVFAPVIRRDYSVVPSSEVDSDRVLSKLAFGAPSIRQACVGELADLIRQGDPPHPGTLAQVLRLLLDVSDSGAPEWLALARERLANLECDDPPFTHWWSFLATRDPVAAVKRLESGIAEVASPDAVMVAFCSALGSPHDLRREDRLAALRESPEALVPLILLVRKHVRAEEDVSHGLGIVYSRTPRDSAQQFRDSLIGWLAGINHPAATSALDALITRLAPIGIERDWLQHLLATRVVADVSDPMPPEAAAVLMRSLILQPTTEQDLFTIARNRLRDIQHDLAHGDFSLRSVFKGDDKPVLEEPVQNYLATELEHRRRSQYSVVREPEVTRKARPDIRLLNARCGGPVTIEVKIAQRWSVAELEVAISDQLVGTYMRANNSNYGILALCSSGKKNSWRTSAGKALDFERLVAHLVAHAAATASGTPGLAGVAVVAIDFRDPSKLPE